MCSGATESHFFFYFQTLQIFLYEHTLFVNGKISLTVQIMDRDEAHAVCTFAYILYRLSVFLTVYKNLHRLSPHIAVQYNLKDMKKINSDIKI